LEIVAVNHGDRQEAVAKFVEGRYAFPIGMGSGGGAENPIFSAYGVSSYPTTYLINGEGKVLWRGVGFSPEWKKELPAALAEVGIR
jgi:hypothetical protein